MSNGKEKKTSDLDDLFGEVEVENTQQSEYEPTSQDLFGTGTFDTRVYSDTQREELQDKGIGLQEAHQDNFNYNQVMADLQGGGQQFWRATKGALYKGALDVVENIGYLADIPQWVRASEDFDKGYTNWLSEAMAEEKKEFDEENPIYSTGIGDAGWWAQGLSSVGQSAIGFAVPGGIIGKVAGRAAKLANTLVKASKGLELGTAQVMTAFGTNYLESMMMSDEVYNNIYNQAIASGRTQQDAQSIASKNAEEFRAKAKIGVITDAIGVGNLIGGKGLVSGAAQKNLKEKALGVATQMGTEAFEEGAMGFVQKEAERQGAIDIDPKKSDDSGVLERVGDYATSPDGFTEMFFGAAGGPLQSIGAEAVGKGLKATGIGKLTDPGTYNKEKPEFTFDEPRPDVSFDATQKDIDAWEKRKAEAQAKYDKEVKEYEAGQTQHNAKKAQYEEQKKYESTGEIAQTKKDVQEFLEKEAELTKDYATAVMMNDETAMRDIEDKKFENLFLRYAKGKAVLKDEGSLSRQLEAYVNNPELEPERREMAKRYLDKIPEYTKAYNKLMGTYNDNQEMVQTAFTVKARLDSSNDLLEDINNRIDESKADLAKSIKETEGVDPSPSKIEAVSLRKEQMVLEKIKNSQKAKFNPKLEKELERRINTYQKRIDALNETTKGEPVTSKVSTDVITANQKMQEVEKLANDRAQAFTAYTVYKGLNNYVENGNFQSDIEKDSLRFFKDKVNNATSEQELNEALYLLSASAINPSKKKEAEQVYFNKKNEIAQEDAKALARFENAERKYQQLETLNNQIYSKRMSYISKLGQVGRKEKASTSKLKQTIVNSDILSFVKEELSDENKLLLSRIVEDKPFDRTALSGLQDALYAQIQTLESVATDDAVLSQLNLTKEAANNAVEILGEILTHTVNVENSIKTEENIPQLGSTKKLILNLINTDTGKDVSVQDAEKELKELEAERAFAKIEFDNLTRFSKSIGEQLSVAKGEMDKYNSLPGASSFDVNLTNVLDETNTDLSAEETETIAQTTNDTELSTAATQQKTAEATIQDNDPEVIPVKDYPDNSKVPPISNKVNDAQGALVGFYKNIAYLTHSDRETDKTSNFAEWLETTPEQDKVNTVFKFEINNKDFEEFGIEKGDVDNTPIRMYPLNTEGKKIAFGNKATYAYLRVADPIKHGSEGYAWLKEARNAVLSAQSEGRLDKLKPKITAMGSGILKSDTTGETKNDLREKLNKEGEDITLTMYNGEEFKWGKGRDYSFGAITTGTSGFIYASVLDGKADRFPLKLNSRKLNTDEATALYDAVLNVGQNRIDNTEKVRNEDFEGLTYKQLIDFLVYNGEASGKTNMPLHLNFKTKQLVIKGKAIPFKRISENEDLLKDYFLKMWRTTNSKMLNSKFNDPDSGFSDGFKWFGKEIAFDTSYNDFQFDDQALSTNATFPNGRTFVQPWVELSNPNTWGVKKSTVDTKANTEQRNDINKVTDTIPTDQNFGGVEDNVPDNVPVLTGMFSKKPTPEVIPDPQQYNDPPSPGSNIDPDPPVPIELEGRTGQTKPLVEGTNAIEEEKSDVEPGPASEVVPEKRVKKVRKKRSGGKTYKQDDFSMWKGTTEKANLKQEISWLNNTLPNIPSQIRKSLIRVPGGMAEGMLYNGTVVLSDLANKGIVYHEAFHAVSKMYLAGDARKALYTEASNTYGSVNNQGEPKTDRGYEEDLAEGFREYMINKGELKLPKTIKWLYDIILDLVNVFRSEERKVFSQIRAGRFDYKPVTGSGATLANRLPFPSDFIDEAVKGMTYLVFKYSGVRSMDRDVDNIGEEDLYDAVFDHIQEEYEKAYDESNYGVSDNLDKILEDNYWPSFLALAKDEVMSYGFDIRKDDLDTVESEDTVSGNLNIENAVNSSVKSSATNNTKLMVSMLKAVEKTDEGLQGVGSKWFGRTMPKLADKAKSWSMLEQGLTGIIDYSDNEGVELKAPDQMLSAIKKMAETYPPFSELVAQLESKKVPLYKKTSFYKTFSKTNIEYIMSVGNDVVDSKGKPVGIEWNVGSADIQAHANTIRNQWYETFGYKAVDENGKVLYKDSFKKIVAGYKKFNDNVYKLKSVTADDLKQSKITISKLLSDIGIDVSPKTVGLFIESQKGTGQLEKLRKATKSLHFIFAPKGNKVNSISLETMLKPGYVYDEKLNFINDNSVVLRLAAIEAQDANLPGERMVHGSDGKAYFTISQNNFMSKMMGRYKSNVKYVDDILASTYHNKSQWLMELKNEFLQGESGLLDKFKIKAFLLNRYDDKSDTSTEMETPDEITDRMTKTLAGAVEGGKSIFTPLTMADKSMLYQFEGFAFRKYNFESQESPVSARALDQFYNYALAEIERISKVAQTKETFDYYSTKGGLQSMWFPDLSYNAEVAIEIGLYNEDGSINIIDPVVKQSVQKLVAKSLKRAVRKEYNYLMDKKILNSKEIIGLSESIKREYGATADNKNKKNNTYRLVADYALNSMMANIEFTMMFTGDPAFFKDLSKRTPFTIATGDDMMMVDKVPSKFKLAVIKDLYRPSLLLGSNEKDKETGYYKEFKDRGIDTSVLEPYSGINLGDAQGYCTPKRFRDIMRGFGKWNDAVHDPIYNRLTDLKEFAAEDLSKMQDLMRENGVPSGQPLKGMHGQLRKDGNKMVPVYVKYSLAPLWPAVIKGTNLEALVESMGTNVDEVVFQSGVKGGAKDITDAKDLFEKGSSIELKPFELDNFYYKLQQDLPAKYDKKEKTLRASQPPKNIVANIEGKIIQFGGKPLEGNEIARLVHETESLLSDLGRESFEKEFGVKDGVITDKKRFYDSMVDKFVRDKVSNNLIEQLRSDDTPIDAIFQFADKLDSELHSKITKKTVKLEAQGGAFIQLSSAGFLKQTKVKDLTKLPIKDRNGILHLTDVKGGLLGPRREGGETKSGQIYLPYKAVEKIPNLTEQIQSGKLTGEKLKDILGDTIKGFVGYRIPNQGMSSIDTLEIVGILPPHMGDTIVTYDEVPAKTGADFDIDKMYIMMPHTQWNTKTKTLEKVPSGTESKEALENRRLELWNAILTAEGSFVELVMPLDSDWLRDDAYYIALLESISKGETDIKDLGYDTVEELTKDSGRKAKANKYFKERKMDNLEFASPNYQLELKKRNVAGKVGVGQTANHLSHHPQCQYKKLSLLLDLGIGHRTEDGFVDLSEKKIKGGDLLITNVISAWLNAYVDNAKDPYISLINNNTKTANTVFMLLRAGVDPVVVNRFISQPIIKKYVENQFTMESKVLPKDFKAFSTVLVDKNGQLQVVEKVNSIPDAYVTTMGDFNVSPSIAIAKKEKDLTDFDVNALEGMIVETYNENTDPAVIEDQVSLLNTYLKYEFYARKLNEAVRATKADTEGAYGNSTENMAARELIQKVKDEGFVKGFDKLFEGTFIEAYDKNATQFSDKVFSNMLISKSQEVQATVKSISNMQGFDYSTDKNLIGKISKAMRSYKFGGFDKLTATREELAGMLQSNDGMASKLLKLKETMAGDPLIEALGIKKVTPKITTITLPSSKHKEQAQSDKLWMAWEKMFDTSSKEATGNIEIEKGYNVSDFAKDLVKLAFSTSGFQKNLNSFYDLIPHTYMRGDFGGENFNNYVKGVLNESKFGTVNETFIDQFYRHNSSDIQLVPQLNWGKDAGSFVKKVGGSIENEGFKIEKDKMPSKFKAKIDGEYIVPNQYVSLKKALPKEGKGPTEYETYLFKYAGFKGGEYYFQAITPLGLKERGDVVVEYNPDIAPASIVNTRRKGFDFTQISELTENEISTEEIGYEEDGIGELINEGTDQYSLSGVDNTSFEIRKVTVDKQQKFAMFARTPYNNLRQVAENFNTKEEALNAGLEKLKSLGSRRIERTIKNLC